MSRFKVVGPREARALAACGVEPIWARSGTHKPWVFCDPEDSALYNFKSLADEDHFRFNETRQYKVEVE